MFGCVIPRRQCYPIVKYWSVTSRKYLWIWPQKQLLSTKLQDCATHTVCVGQPSGNQTRVSQLVELQHYRRAKILPQCYYFYEKITIHSCIHCIVSLFWEKTTSNTRLNLWFYSNVIPLFSNFVRKYPIKVNLFLGLSLKVFRKKFFWRYCRMQIRFRAMKKYFLRRIHSGLLFSFY